MDRSLRAGDTVLRSAETMTECFYPRLSLARDFLPVLRAQLVAAASRHPLYGGLSLDLLPVVEDGVFGYELVSDRNTHTYLTVGCNARREPIVRTGHWMRRCPLLIRIWRSGIPSSIFAASLMRRNSALR